MVCWRITVLNAIAQETSPQRVRDQSAVTQPEVSGPCGNLSLKSLEETENVDFSQVCEVGALFQIPFTNSWRIQQRLL